MFVPSRKRDQGARCPFKDARGAAAPTRRGRARGISGRRARGVITGAVTLSVALWLGSAEPARADDYGATHAMSPTLPAIASTSTEVRTTLTLARLVPVTGASPAGVYVQMFAVETALFQPWLHFGLRYGVGGGEAMSLAAPGNEFLSANPAMTFRASWESGHGVSFSAGLIAYLPAAIYRRERAVRDVALGVRSGWLGERGMFFGDGFATAPHIDLRVDVAILTFQLRQAVDLGFAFDANVTRSLSATTTVYGAMRLGVIVPAVEVTQRYTLDADAPDETRSSVSIMPHVSLLGRLSPFLGFVFSGTPDHPLAQDLWGVRLGSRVEF